MRVLCINTNGLRNDGITNSILDYFSHMNRDGISVDVLLTCDVDSEIKEKFEKKLLNLVFVEYRRNPFSYVRKTAKLIKEKKYDIVHVHGSSALLSLDLLAAKIGGCKVRIAHSRNTTCNHKVMDCLLRFPFYWLCNKRFACGEAAGKWLFKNRDFTIIKNGKDLNKFHYNEYIRKRIREKYGWQNKVVIGHVGNFNCQKNHEFLINVFSELSKKNDNYMFVLIGSGQRLIMVKELAVQLGIKDKVLFTGSINNVPDLLQGMDIMTLPSLFEGLPNVVLEWQALGLPAIISDKVTHECEVTDLLTYLPIDQGIDCWVENILNIFPVDRQKASEKARLALVANGFDIEKDAEELRNLYLKFMREA